MIIVVGIVGWFMFVFLLYLLALVFGAQMALFRNRWGALFVASEIMALWFWMSGGTTLLSIGIAAAVPWLLYFLFKANAVTKRHRIARNVAG